ncbi:flavodoxin family protein [Anaerocolumna sp. AGMB13025]|uniref:flavodoxin family protein n=1 Tax=Anaerocolumna sp. AGMB13025 TaxID=3039116 RepID=UPI00241F9D5E|nr:flavodoxin family protein [Anaerocolumna sp. AGMB13025]WFR55132.1 flavodoxin family protein [Anaerocolumna sp. AGMB13025]
MAATKKVEVRYYSKTGNTAKLAEAIGDELLVKAKSVEVPIEGDVDILFLGSSVYGAGVDNKVKTFINSLDSRVKTVVNFSTAAILPSTYGQIKKLLGEKGIALEVREFHCRGEFKFMHKGKPDAQDIKNVREFARKIVS